MQSLVNTLYRYEIKTYTVCREIAKYVTIITNRVSNRVLLRKTMKL